MTRFDLVLAAVLALLIGTAAQASSILVAKNDGTQTFTSALYNSGFGTLADANYIANNLASYDSLGSNVIVKITIGSVEDFFRPVSGNTLLEMLTSSSKHEWSAAETGPFVAPDYAPSDFLGGSTTNWPADNAAGDNRNFLPFWGYDGSESFYVGGCCHTSLESGGNWNQSFTMEIVSAVPLPAGIWLMLGGLGATAALRRRRAKALG